MFNKNYLGKLKRPGSKPGLPHGQLNIITNKVLETSFTRGHERMITYVLFKSPSWLTSALIDLYYTQPSSIIANPYCCVFYVAFRSIVIPKGGHVEQKNDLLGLIGYGVLGLVGWAGYLLINPPDPPPTVKTKPAIYTPATYPTSTTKPSTTLQFAPPPQQKVQSTTDYNDKGCPKNQYVSGYYRKNGTYVEGYWRNSPSDNC